MNGQQRTTTGIVLRRTDFSEADRILTVLTPDAGKLRLMAKGVRRVKSKLAGGIELFSVSDITYLRGRGEIGTLVSARLQTHYGRIVQDINRTMLGYELIGQLDKATEDEPEQDYFYLLQRGFTALNEPGIAIDLVRLWFQAQLLWLGGHTPNLQAEPDGTKLAAGQTYGFSFDDSAFTRQPDGVYATDDIKFLRLIFAGHQPSALAQIQSVADLTARTEQLVKLMFRQYIH